MKKVMALFVITIISLFIIESGKYQCAEKNRTFHNIENIMLRNYKFVQNGIKVEYTTNSSIDKEQELILERLMKNSTSKLEIVQAEGSILAFDENINYNITLYGDEKTRVEIEVLNNSNNNKIDNLQEMVQKIKSNNCIEERYYSFIKGKLNSTKDGISIEIMNDIEEKTVQSIEISTGKITKAKLKDGSAVSIGQISYNTGEYLIIGTPVIFTTY